MTDAERDELLLKLAKDVGRMQEDLRALRETAEKIAEQMPEK